MSTAAMLQVPTALQSDVERIFATVLPRHIAGYETRQQQLDMARLVARGLDESRHVIAEAGTGTGKSFAVLIPAILWALRNKKTVIVSTGTIALQEQYMRDLEFLRRVMPEPFTFELAKGKGQYLCLDRLEDAISAGLIHDKDPLYEWAAETTTGDRADYISEDTPEAWSLVNADDSCTGSDCPLFQECHYYRAKREWADADILVTNHALLMMALQYNVLPEWHAVIVDEAHHLPDVARDALGSRFSYGAVHRLSGQALRHGISGEQVAELRRAAATLFDGLVRGARETRFAVETLPVDAIRHLGLHLGRLERALRDKDTAKATKLADQAERMNGELHGAIRSVESGLNAAWVEIVRRDGRDDLVYLHITPLFVGGLLRALLLNRTPVVMTSATLTASNNSLRYFVREVGANRPSDEETWSPDREPLTMSVSSPFNYRRQSLLYIADDLPDPRTVEFYPAAAVRIEEILHQTDGRAFVLFTSYAGMNQCYDALRHRLPYTVLRQGDAPRTELVRRFAEDRHSVLFATSSFWEGVDVPGDALSCVIIDKLPFDPPDDPVASAMARSWEAEFGEGSSFRALALPRATLRMKQGVGRLIRSSADRGLVAILDRRLAVARYGGLVLSALPPMRRIRGVSSVRQWFEGVAR